MDREFTTYVDRHFETVDQRFEKVDQRFGSLEHQIDERGQKTEQSLREFRRAMNDRFVGFENLLQVP